MSKRIYIGAICNRDVEVFDQIKKFSKVHYNNKISIVSLLKKDNSFSTKHFKKKIKKYPISFLIVKLYSEPSNQIIYNAIRTYLPNIPILNSMDSVSTCESRNETFRFLVKKFKKLNIPKTYFSIKNAYDACCQGVKIIIKLDIHNAPHVSKDDRILGIAKTPEQFLTLIHNYEEEKLFFQEYLGKFDLVHKLYVIGKFSVCITSHNRFRHDKLSQLELIHIRVPIEKKFKREILRLGRKLRLSIFGVDFIITEDGTPFIVDLNDFPSFRNVPEAVSLISDHIYNLFTSKQTIYKTPIKVKVN